MRQRQKKYSIFFSVLPFLLLFVILFFLSVFWFRRHTKQNRQEENQKEQTQNITETEEDLFSEGISGQVTLFPVEGAFGSAQGQRNIDPVLNVFSFALQAQLSPIDPEKFFYEVWFVRPFPFDFFSLGEMTLNEEGIFLLNWLGEPGKEKEYASYLRVIITQEPIDQNSAPSKHVLEGAF